MESSLFHQGSFNRLKGCEIKTLYLDLIANNPESLRHFPESCLKRPPPKVYFWKIFSIIRNADYRIVLQKVFENGQANHIISDSIYVTPEYLDVMNSLENSKSLAYLRIFIRQEERKSLKGIRIYFKII